MLDKLNELLDTHPDKLTIQQLLFLKENPNILELYRKEWKQIINERRPNE